MRVTINGFEVEGTPDEVAALIRAQQVVPVETNNVISDVVQPGDSEDERFASEKIAYRALRRRPLSSAQKTLLQVLFKAYPNWTTASDLQAATGYNPNQFGGLLGALGRRLSQTEGYVRDSALIEWIWDADESAYLYRLPSSVYHAVRRINP